MLKVTQIKCRPGNPLSREDIAGKLRCLPSDILSFEADRESIDARKEELYFVYSVYVSVRNEEKYLRLKDVAREEKPVYTVPEVTNTSQRPLVVGFGPAGMFAGLILAEAGCRPVIIERGRQAEDRAKDVKRFFEQGILDAESNVQYGEGGAGTFSDGKLTTRIKNYRIRKVLAELVEAGADPAIMYQAMPHLGTDRLQEIVRNIRRKIISLGGEVHFRTRMENLIIKDRKVCGVNTNRGVFEASEVILCLGHSASETYRNLFEQGFEILPKDFAAGVRVEHPQEMINRNQYGRFADHPSLGPASYRLSYRSSLGRGVYSFCMCPGGTVIPASTEEGLLVVNGMSESSRSGRNANSALLVQIPQSDFYRSSPLDGFAFQKELEKKAFRTGYAAPAQNISDYAEGRKTAEWNIASSYPRGVISTDMRELFSDAVNLSLREAVIHFDRQIPGFVNRGLMIGMESRSSSPIRMIRSEDGMSSFCAGVFPCGEGAGYAGGIVSSAVDGIKQAENVIRCINNL